MGESYSTNKKREKFINKLQCDGHSCVKIMNSYPIEYTWCGKDRCIANMRTTESFILWPKK